MQTTRCSCGNTLFFESSQCVACGRVTGLCPNCFSVHDLDASADEEGVFSCGNCSAPLRQCQNFAVEQVCNGCFPAGDGPDRLCELCTFTQIIPDLSVAGNRERWMRLENAKRRVLASIVAVGVPLSRLQREPPLRFEFLADDEELVTTGHHEGLITINIKEADDVEREISRVALGEPHRTLVGHFRHELGHYFWEQFVKKFALPQFRQLFGDETAPAYKTAQKNYYEAGAPADWPARYVSAYAAMHPWEDFAETFGTYLDLRAVLNTAQHFGICEPRADDFRGMLTAYREVGVIANEWNRDMGLLDLVPEVFVELVTQKLEFIHRLMERAAGVTSRRAR